MKNVGKTLLATLLVSMSGITISTTAHAGDPAVSEAQLLAAMCNTCHGQNGTGAKPNPSINGEDPVDFVDLMKAFASGEEPTSIMDRHASGYTDAQLQAIAEYYSEQ